MLAAKSATERHNAAIGRMQMAGIRRDGEVVQRLALVVREARNERERATAAYQRHTGTHRAQSAGMSAAAGGLVSEA